MNIAQKIVAVCTLLVLTVFVSLGHPSSALANPFNQGAQSFGIEKISNVSSAERDIKRLSTGDKKSNKTCRNIDGRTVCWQDD